MTHLTPDEIIDAVEGALDADRRSHAEACEACRRAVAELAAVLGEARQVGVPEPSAIFWRQLSARVRSAVDVDRGDPSWWRPWLRWPVLAPMGALALLVLALTLSVPATGPVADVPAAAHSADDNVALAADSWTLVAELIGALDWETAARTGFVVQPGAADRAALDLSPDEQQELTRLLRLELRRTES